MKKLLIYPTTIIFLAMLLFSCKKDDDNSTPSPTITSTISQGNWRISYFNDSGNDETSHFTGYSFQFNSNGNLTATKGSDIKNGTWSNGGDDSQSKLVINMGSTPPFDDLNEDWHVTSQSSTSIKLEHVSGGNGGTDILHFEKI